MALTGITKLEIIMNAITNAPVATIKHSTDEDLRIELSVVQNGDKFTIETDTGETVGEYEFASRQDALDAIESFYRGECWDLQWSI